MSYVLNQVKRLLLISNSTLYGSGYLDHAQGEIQNFLGNLKRVIFVPFALYDRDAYSTQARKRLKGTTDARIFRRGHDPVEVGSGTALDHLVSATLPTGGNS